MIRERRGALVIVEWTPGKWWVCRESERDGSLTPLHEGVGNAAKETHRALLRKMDCESWADANQPGGTGE